MEDLYTQRAVPLIFEHKMASQGLINRALDKWEISKSLPRKKKKLMRKDALLDFQIGSFGESLLTF